MNEACTTAATAAWSAVAMMVAGLLLVGDASDCLKESVLRLYAAVHDATTGNKRAAAEEAVLTVAATLQMAALTMAARTYGPELSDERTGRDRRKSLLVSVNTQYLDPVRAAISQAVAYVVRRPADCGGRASKFTVPRALIAGRDMVPWDLGWAALLAAPRSLDRRRAWSSSSTDSDTGSDSDNDRDSRHGAHVTPTRRALSFQRAASAGTAPKAAARAPLAPSRSLHGGSGGGGGGGGG